MVEVIMVVCLAVILFILIRRFPDTAKVETKVEKSSVQSVTRITQKDNEIVEEVAAPKYAEKVEALLKEAHILIGENKQQLAEDKLIEAIKIDLNCATAYSILGDIYLDRKRTAEAEETYRAAIRHDNKEASAHFGLALILEEKGRFNDAVAELLLAIKVDGKNDIWFAKLGELYEGTRMFAKAAMAYKKAASLKPDYGRYKELALAAEKKRLAHKTRVRV